MNEQLVPWDKISGVFENKDASLLLGKGFSCAVWDRFKDSSLYEEASSENNGGISLSAENKELFKALRTESFEKVLATLSTTKIVNNILEAQAHKSIIETIDVHSANIKHSLIQAVKEVHIPWTKFSIKKKDKKKVLLKEERQEREVMMKMVKENTNILKTIRTEVLKYQNLFYTSYDLLIYWSLMTGDKKKFADYFTYDGKFDKQNYIDKNKELRENRLSVFYIHGCLHLYFNEQEIRKIVNQGPEKNILQQWGEVLRESAGNQPLFMAEGTLIEKLNFIYNSDYLFVAYNEFKQTTGKLVVLGNPLNFDKNQENNSHLNHHLVDAIVKKKHQEIAISLTEENGEIIQQMDYWKRVMNRDDITFFEEKTHPLCNPDIIRIT